MGSMLGNGRSSYVVADTWRVGCVAIRRFLVFPLISAAVAAWGTCCNGGVPVPRVPTPVPDGLPGLPHSARTSGACGVGTGRAAG